MDLMKEIQKVRDDSDFNERIKWIKKFTGENVSNYIPDTVGILLYLKHKKKIDIGEKYENYIQQNIEKYRKKKEIKIKEEKQKSNKYEQIKKTMNEQLTPVLSDIDVCFDELFETGETNFDEVIIQIKKKGLSSRYISFIKTYIEKHYINDLKEVNSDEQLKEAYSFLSKRQINKIIKTVENFLDKIDTIGKVNRKPKKINIAKKIKNLKYKQTDKELGVSSFSPIKIWGANEVWVYNTEKRKLRVFKSDEGLIVKGTTLYNFNESSWQITIREKKVKETIKIIAEGKRRAINNFEKEVKKKPIKTGRISENDILLFYK